MRSYYSNNYSTTSNKNDTFNEQLSESIIPDIIHNQQFSPLNFEAPSENIRAAVTLKNLLATNLHLGHNKKIQNKFMSKFIFGQRNNIQIINLDQTLVYLRKAINVTREVSFAGGNILFVGTRPAIHNITVQAAVNSNSFYTLDWIPGTITNKERVLRKSVGYDPDKIAQIQSLQISEGEELPTTQPYVHQPDLLILLDYQNTKWAAREANLNGIPIIAVCDTDLDPTLIQYPIPANDDSVKGIEYLSGVLSWAAREGYFIM
ncbi:28S ribosomal protein S2, mitochondrial [Clydaea vesicula]|uniref:28S ribosomal protein S2, mitochondrial n=1 Tax=Clydaea vesicula TaxID=447962 RepID=A0AAD5TW87_9FUNG|nr:28S ribosomal protein S2, mitochondrial [Clydaea vesicula]